MSEIILDEVTNRTRLFKALTESSAVMDIVEGRILAASSIDQNTDIERPYMTYRMHTAFPVGRRIGGREYGQVWANDDPGDYMRIDRVLRAAKLAIEALPSETDFLEATWIETSIDLADSAMGVINRYSRFQFTNTLRETAS